MLQPPTKFEFHTGDTLSVSVLIGLETLTFDLELGARYCPQGRQLSYQLW